MNIHLNALEEGRRKVFGDGVCPKCGGGRKLMEHTWDMETFICSECGYDWGGAHMEIVELFQKLFDFSASVESIRRSLAEVHGEKILNGDSISWCRGREDMRSFLKKHDLYLNPYNYVEQYWQFQKTHAILISDRKEVAKTISVMLSELNSIMQTFADVMQTAKRLNPEGFAMAVSDSKGYYWGSVPASELRRREKQGAE